MLSRPVPKSFLQHLEMRWTSPGERDVKVGGKCPDISWFCLGTKIKPPSSAVFTSGRMFFLVNLGEALKGFHTLFSHLPNEIP